MKNIWYQRNVEERIVHDYLERNHVNNITVDEVKKLETMAGIVIDILKEYGLITD